MPRTAVLAEGFLGRTGGKTATGLLLHSLDPIVAVVDSGRAGQDAGEVALRRRTGVPVVARVGEAVDLGAERLVVGIAVPGGVLPVAFRRAVLEALQAGVDVVSGLHTFLGDDPGFRAAAEASGAAVVDVRRPPEGLRVADGRIFDCRVPRVLVMGVDCDSGKRVTAVELHREARRRGLDAGFVATGQTGCLLSPDAGAVIDRVPSDFCAGQVERMVCDVAEAGRSMVVLYGQAGLTHPAFGGVALSILQGSRPDVVVLQHVPGRVQRAQFTDPRYRVGDVREEIRLVEALGGTRVVAVGVNPQHAGDSKEACRAVSQETGLPAADVLRGGAPVLLDAVLEGLAAGAAPPAVAGTRP